MKVACYCVLVVWLVLELRRRWRAAGLVVDARRNNRNPYINRTDP